MVEEIKEMGEEEKMENPGGKECPPYFYAGGDYRPVYSATKDAWELVLANMPKEEQDGSTEEKGTDSEEEESMMGDDRCVEALRSRKETRKEAKLREKKERTSKNKKGNYRWSNLQTEAKQIKEEDDTQMSGVAKKTEAVGEQTDFETTDDDDIVDEHNEEVAMGGFAKKDAFYCTKPVREDDDTQTSGVTEKKEEEGERMEVAVEEDKTSERKRRKVIEDEDRVIGFGPYRMDIWRSVET